ncbi:MAG: hypothetical protein U0570_03790 [Phycisphaerales bacterium]
MLKAAVGVWCVCLVGGSAMGQSLQVLPPANESVAGGTNNYIPLGADTGGRHLTLYAADQLAGIPVGSVITGLQLRQRNAETTAWPSVNSNVTDYEIWLSQSAKTPSTMTTTFADNTLNAVRVRDGSLALAANAYPGGGASGTTPEGWGPVLSFQTLYIYKGGVLGVEFRNTGGPLPTHYADCATNGAAAKGLGTVPDPNGATGTLNSAAIVRLVFTPPPADLAQGVTKVIVDETMAGAVPITGLNTVIRDSARAYAAVASADQFDTIGPGSDFVSTTWRLYSESGSAWPLAVANFADFNLQLSRSVNAPGALSTTFATNVGADAVTVRSGALSIPVGAFQIKGAESTAPFGYEVGFAQAYHYRGGPLLAMLRHGGQTSGSTEFLDAISSANLTNKVQAIFATTRDAVTGSSAAFAVARYGVDAGTSSPLSQLSPTDGFVGGAPQQFQTILSASELKYIPVGSVIDSLWLRMRSSSGAAPATDIFDSDFEVSLSSATSEPAGMVTTFASNEGADKVLVHDGPFGLVAGSLPAGSDGNFGKLVQFRKNFVYKGGPLCVTIRHTGLSGGSIDNIEAVKGTVTTNRSLFSFSNVAPTGAYFGGGYTGTAMKLGYIPSVMTPNSLSTAEGLDGVALTTAGAYVAQVIIAADQLRTIDVGSAITGMSLRQSASGGALSFPEVETVLSRYDVTIAPAANGPLSASNTLASNIGPGAVAVRSGPMTVPANAYPYSGSGSVPGENAWYVPFGRAYVYTGGDLCITIRSEGVLFASQFFDVDGSASQRGVLKYNLTSADAASASATLGPLAIRLAFTARAFCPWDLNNDGIVEDADFSLFIGSYNTLDCTDVAMAVGCPADFNYDRVVDDTDFVLFLAAYNTLLCP